MQSVADERHTAGDNAAVNLHRRNDQIHDHGDD